MQFCFWSALLIFHLTFFPERFFLIRFLRAAKKGGLYFTDTADHNTYKFNTLQTNT
jgi:hypothetical protein